MNARERILAILKREPVDRIPVDIWHTDEVYQALLKHYAASDDLELYRKMGVDKMVWVFPTYTPPGEAEATGSTHLGAAPKSMWGTPLREIQAGQATYQEFGEGPLAEYQTPESIDEYPFWPDPDRFDYDTMTAQAERAHSDFTVLGPWVSLFEIYCQMRGFENSMIDLLTYPQLVNAVLDRIERCQTEMMQRFFERAAEWIDMVFVSDDMGNQNSLFMAPEVWDRYFKDRLKRWCDLIHDHGLKVFYHSDGAVGDLIPRLIDCGLDILNPIQHACPGMDREDLKREYGDRVIFHGGIENQKILPFGAPDDVRSEVRECLRTLGKGREGYIVCSCHNIQPGTPVENIVAMVETVHGEG
jgi:uroporphyrinogen decarboxylase